MRRSLFVSVTLALLTTVALAQVDTAWVRRFSSAPGAIDSATALITDPEGNVYVTGRSDTLGQADIVTLKYDPYGNLLWRARFNGGYGTDIPYAISYRSGPNKGSGTVHVTGTSKGSGKVNNYRFVTLCYRADSGNLRWARLDSGVAGSNAGQDLTVDADGNTYAVGYLGVNDSLNVTVLTVVSYDTAGFLRWRYSWFGSNSLSSRGVAIDFASPPGKGSGTVHVTGTSKSGDNDAVNDNVVTLAFNSNTGGLKWSASFDLAGRNDSAVAIAADPTSYGRVFVAAAARDSLRSYFATIAYDSLGNTAWQRVLDGGAGVNRPYAIATTTPTKGSGTVHVTGTSKGSGKAGDLDYFTVCYSAEGMPQWTRRYDGGNGDDIAYAIAIAGSGAKGSGTVHVTGTSKGSGKATTWDIYTVAYASTGVELWNHRYDNGRTDIGLAIGTDTSGAVFVTGPSNGSMPDTSLDYVTIKLRPPVRVPAHWDSVITLPGGLPTGVGSWLACNANTPEADGRVYVCAGKTSSSFWAYDPATSSWTPLPSYPPGPSGKAPGRGSRGTAAAGQRIYSVKAGNTAEFWAYDIPGARWVQLADVPLGPSNKKVKNGADLDFVPCPSGDSSFIYLLKGNKSEFWRYNINTNTWSQLPDAPAGVRPKWDKGSFIVYDGDRTVYAHKAKYVFGDPPHHELWAYDIITGQWLTDPLPGMPLWSLFNGTLRRKKVAEGAAGAWNDNSLYALKGGNTLSLFAGSARNWLWQQLADMPAGASGKRVKVGGDLDGNGIGRLYALKGNKTPELHCYSVGGKAASDGIAARPVTATPARPATIVRSILYLPSSTATGTLLIDAAGRRRMALKPGLNDLSGLAPGIYFIQRLTTGNEQPSLQKVVVTH